MRLVSSDFDHLARLQPRFAFGAPDPVTHVRLSDNLNPALAWSELPPAARSLVLLCVDPDVPTRPDDVNREGRTVATDLARTRCYHWVMVDIAPVAGSMATGACSTGVTPRGKRTPSGPAGSRQGINDYTHWFAGDPQMSGEYFGYDGPCPPWNDERLHHYHFILYAIDLDRYPVTGAFAGSQVEAAIAGHVLAEARLTGTYSLNPRC